MTSFAPSPHGPDSSMRVRVKWDNVMIVLIGVVAATFAVVGILMFSSSSAKPTATPKDPSPATAPAAHDMSAMTDDAAPGELSLDDAVSVVEEVRTLMTEGRWDEATDRLELIPTDLRDASGATVAEQELTDRRASHDRLRAQLEAAVEAHNWKGARSLLAQLAELAPLDADLTATQGLVDTALAPKATATAAAATETSKATASAGGGAAPAPANTPSVTPTTKPATKPAATTKPVATTKPAATTKPTPGTPKPATGGARPAVTGGGAATGGANGSTSDIASIAAGAGANSSLGNLGINLTPQQEAELEAALDQAMAGL